MEDEAEGQNRRKSERMDVAFTLVYNVDKPYSLRIGLGLTNEADALMLNLSDTGVAIITKHGIPLNTELSIGFNIIDLRLTGDARCKNMQITGVVVSSVIMSNENNRISYRLGIRFTRISNEDKIRISDFVKFNTLAYSLRISSDLIAAIDALMVDLSDSCMSIITQQDLSLGTGLSIKFNIINSHLAGDARWVKMKIDAEVTSNVVLLEGVYKLSRRIGVRFINISNADKIAINDFVKRNMFSFQ